MLLLKLMAPKARLFGATDCANVTFEWILVSGSRGLLGRAWRTLFKFQFAGIEAGRLCKN
jgi:hypothetical protein